MPPSPARTARSRSRSNSAGAAWGIVTYATDRIHEEIAYIAFHFHWSLESILDLEHRDRRRYTEQIAALVSRASGEG